MNWMNLCMKLFGTTEIWGINMGFWVSIGIVFIIVVLMNVVFWMVKPKNLDEVE